MSGIRDEWAAGPTYETFMGRWSRQLAAEFVSWLAIPDGARWLDVGCGTGALTEAICNVAHPASVLGCDPAEPFVEYARGRFRDGRVSFVVAGSGSLPGRPGGYGSVSSLFALNFFPDHEAAVDEMRSLTAAGGVVSACVWDYRGGMQFLRHFWDAVVATDPAARGLDEGARFPVCRPEALTELFRGSGLGAVSCESIRIRTDFAGFDDYWQPLLGGTGPAPSYVSSLGEERRAALARMLERTLPREADGAIHLTARAWAVRGTVS
jgi:SAM-dependent methyltransferase